MPSRTSFIAAASLALCLQACVTGKPPVASAPASYFWLPLIGISDAGTARTRDAIDAMLRERGNVPGYALALALSTDRNPGGDGGLGLGAYAGGYAYYAPAPAPRDAVVVEAFDTRSLRSVWRATLSRTTIDNEAELRRALAVAISRFPPPGAAGQGPRVEPDARGDGREASIGTGRQTTQPVAARPIAADGKPAPLIRSLSGAGGAERARRIQRPRALSPESSEDAERIEHP